MKTKPKYPPDASVSETNFLRFMQKFKMAAKVAGNDFFGKVTSRL